MMSSSFGPLPLPLPAWIGMMLVVHLPSCFKVLIHERSKSEKRGRREEWEGRGREGGEGRREGGIGGRDGEVRSEEWERGEEGGMDEGEEV